MRVSILLSSDLSDYVCMYTLQALSVSFMIAITFMLLRLHLPEVGLCYFILCLQLIKLKYEVNLVNVCLLKLMLFSHI